MNDRARCTIQMSLTNLCIADVYRNTSKCNKTQVFILVSLAFIGSAATYIEDIWRLFR
jgi:hypothetical protein